MIARVHRTIVHGALARYLFLIFVCLPLLLGGCGRSLEEEMRAKAALMVNAPEAEVTAEPSGLQTEEVKTEVPAPPITSSAVSAPAAPVETPVAPPIPTPAANVASLPVAPPRQQPLTAEEARVRSAQNLERIATALLAYVEHHKSLPDAAITVTRGEQDVALLSWRVKLLPYLGYEDLYKQFRLKEAWNSPHNKKLLAQIPAEYQSPDRFDTSTNYVIPVGNQTAFSGGRGRIPANFTGGAENVVMLLELDDTNATPWTAPKEFTYQAAAPRTGLGTLRGDGFLVALANGDVGIVPASVADSQLRELFSIEEDSAPAGAVVQAATSNSPSATAASVTSTSAEESSASPGPRTAEAPAAASTIDLSELIPSRPPRSAVPEPHLLQAARMVLRDLYRKEYESAKTAPARRELVARMLADAREFKAQPAEYYESLRVTRDLAVSVGMPNEALEAVGLLEAQFEVDGPAMRASTLDELCRLAVDPALAQLLASQTALLFRQSLYEDDFATATRAHEVYLRAQRAARDSQGGIRPDEVRAAIEAMKAAYSEVPEAIRTLRANPNDSKANAIVGRYYCVLKQRWEQFLPLLAKGDDVSLRVIATIDLENSSDPAAVLQLADQYWNLAEESPAPFNVGLRMRAVHHYSRSVDKHPGGLARVRAQKRLQQWRERPDWVNLLEPSDAATSAPASE